MSLMTRNVCKGDNPTNENRVYVACLDSYNNGKHKGKTFTKDELIEAWHDCDEWDEFFTGEYAVHDWDGEIARVGQYLGEQSDMDIVISWLECCDEIGGDFVPAFLFATDIFNDVLPSMLYDIIDNWEIIDDLADWAEEFCFDVGYVDRPNGWSPINYIDWQHVGLDMLNDYYEYEYGAVKYIIHHGALH